MKPTAFMPYLYYLELAYPSDETSRSLEDFIDEDDEVTAKSPRYSFWRPFASIFALVAIVVLFAVVPMISAGKVNSLADVIDIFTPGTSTPPIPGTGPGPVGDPSVDGTTTLSGYFLQGDQLVFINYPRSMGILDYPGAMPFDQSIIQGKDNTVAAIKQARTDDPDATIVVGGLSQGADAVTRTIKQLESENYDTSNMQFILMGNVDRSNGGIAARFPAVYIPGVGITLGTTTSSQYTHVTEITNQYDLAADAPAYLFNPLSWINAALGFQVYGTHVYDTTNINDPSAIVTRNSSGTITDILIPEKGLLPILVPFYQVGVPVEFLGAINPLVQSLIETGYDRPTNGVAPDSAQRLQLFPMPDKWLGDVQSVSAGAQETGQRLAALTPKTPAAAIAQVQGALSPANISSRINFVANSLGGTIQAQFPIGNAVQNTLSQIPQPSVPTTPLVQQTVSKVQQTVQSAASQVQSVASQAQVAASQVQAQATSAVHQIFGIFGF